MKYSVLTSIRMQYISERGNTIM